MIGTCSGLRSTGLLLIILLLASTGIAQDDYLRWDIKQAQKTGNSMSVNGRVGGVLDTRIISTSKSYNFKLKATWFTPEVIRATARYFQLRQGLSESATRALVEEAEAVDGTVIMVEIDPREGSGVIPLDWEAYLRPDGAEVMTPAIKNNDLRKLKVFESVTPRDYSYERFWLVFPYVTPEDEKLFLPSTSKCALFIRINDKEGRVNWTIPDSIHREISAKKP